MDEGRANQRNFSRRAVVAGLAATTGVAKASQVLAARGPSGIAAIAFDAFPIFNSAPLIAISKSTFGDTGDALAKGWLGRIFSSMWMVTAASQFVDFRKIARTALLQSAVAQSVEMNDAQVALFMRQFYALDIWPDAVAALEQLQKSGINSRFLSNLPMDILLSNMRRHGLERLMGPPISTTEFRTYKPARAAYDLGISAFRLPQNKIGFVASTGWDATGASWFGYRTLLTARSTASAETLEVAPYRVEPDLRQIMDFALNGQ